MDLTLSDDQQLLQQTCAEFFARRSPSAVVRAAEPLGNDATLWREAVDLGIVTAAVPADSGGGGGGMVDLAIVAFELGRRLAPIPLVDAAPAVNLMARLGLADDLHGVTNLAMVPTFTAQPLEGNRVEFLPSGAVADIVLVPLGDEVLAIAVGSTRAREPLANFADAPLGHVDIDGLTVRVVASGSGAVALVARADLERRVLMAAALTGLATEALAITLDYVKERQVYDRPVAAFQAVQHRLADVAVGIEGSRLLAFEAAWSLDEHTARAEEFALMSLAFASDVAFRAVREGLQFHGGYGYTNEFDIQLYFRRAKGWPLIMGQAPRSWQRIAALAYPRLGATCDRRAS